MIGILLVQINNKLRLGLQFITGVKLFALESGTAAPAACDLIVINAGFVIVDVGRGPVVPGICGLIVIDISQVNDGRGRGRGMAAPAARDLIIVNAGRR
jgi:hypothetical protein